MIKRTLRSLWSELARAEKLGLTTDCWTVLTNESYIIIICRFISADWEDAVQWLLYLSYQMCSPHFCTCSEKHYFTENVYRWIFLVHGHSHFCPLLSTTGYLSLLPEDRSQSSRRLLGVLASCACVNLTGNWELQEYVTPPVSISRQTPPTHSLAHGKAHLSHCFAASE